MTGRERPDAGAPGQVWPVIPLAALPITDATIDETARDFILRAVSERVSDARPFYSTSANGQVIALCHHDREFDAMLRQADQIHADGMSLVIFSRKFCRQALRERVATTDLVHAVAKRAEETGSRFYFLGGSEEVNRAAVEEMQRLYPRLVFSGRRNGYFSRAEEDAVLADIAASKTDILWVGFGIPLEQRFVSRNLDRLSGIAVIKTCGGLFDFLAGKNSRAPQWMQDMGLEWLYRAMLEPKRLGKRYLLTNPIAIYSLLKYRFGASGQGR
ncbi:MULTISPECIES: polysaccharide biosynthesis UDP-hexose transferase UppL [Agrobacterium]|uniref:polysaccharide biosynthesis UDP-hexose transferase UppL n=1 Tax=Agrobacterium TaxID=357 RepID=UPI0022B84B8B|nr:MULTISPECIES: polysaccharide biosynthesis UDP-hexose transferase UppL [Agrobacterium]MCZ7887580.1 polysaccharide biosynthesis UDP-hexose transferase UppL [Agrobacterium salinitolerans]MDA5629797.1 polysaccharide biosynthesis UDP-hexose transferase UppL [Agrobacterium sp. ST15.16.055]MDA6982124.1 polysaccharide biosynthesis UDP-hexose transferase UppL [Agrobacterium salinitolerans]